MNLYVLPTYHSYVISPSEYSLIVHFFLHKKEENLKQTIEFIDEKLIPI